MRLSSVRPLVAVAAVAFIAACDGSTQPDIPLDPAGLQSDLTAAVAATSSPATLSLGTLGPQIDVALGGGGGALGMAGLPAALLKDPAALANRADLRAMVQGNGIEAAAIPQVALGKTFEFEVELGRYAAGARVGAPANGVRFVLYAIDPVTNAIVVPLVETGYVDLTRTVANQVATARVQAYSGGVSPVKAIDYSASIQGSAINPELVVAGFARNAADSLTFSLRSSVSLAQEAISIDWRTAVPTRGLTTRVEQTISGGESAEFELFGVITSTNGRVSLRGTLVPGTGGTITVKVNGDTFATITLTGIEGEPTFLNAQGQPLTETEAAMLRQIFEWFSEAFVWYAALLSPVDRILDAAF